MTAAEATTTRRSGWRWGALGGLLAGALDLVRVAALDRLDPGPVALLAEALVGLAPAAVVGALLGVAAGWARRGRALPGLAAGFAGVAALTVAAATILPATPYGLVAPAPFDRPPPGATLPNVLLVTLDGARADRFEDARVTTTATNRVAVEGVRFRATWAQVPANGPSLATLHTGSAPWDHGVWLDGVSLPEDRPTLAEVLRAAGRDTAAFVSRGRAARGLGFERGFSVYDDDLAWALGVERLPTGRLLALAQRGRPTWMVDRRPGATVDRALAWLEGRDGPWFAWVQIADAEPPFAPPPPYDTRYVPEGGPRDPRRPTLPEGAPRWLGDRHPGVTDPAWLVGLYDGEVASADAQVARLLDALDAAGLADHTLVVVTSPHGMALGEEGRWFRHDGVTEGEVRVPWVARWPGHLTAGTSVDDPVEIGDVAPTIVEWLGVGPPSAWTGTSAADRVVGGPAPRAVARTVAFESDDAGRAWRVSAVRSRRDAWVHRERPGALDAFEGSPTGSEAEDALVADLLAERARDLLRGWDVDAVRRPDLSPAAIRWLDEQGAALRP